MYSFPRVSTGALLAGDLRFSKLTIKSNLSLLTVSCEIKCTVFFNRHLDLYSLLLCLFAHLPFVNCFYLFLVQSLKHFGSTGSCLKCHIIEFVAAVPKRFGRKILKRESIFFPFAYQEVRGPNCISNIIFLCHCFHYWDHIQIYQGLQCHSSTLTIRVLYRSIH